MRGLKGFTLVEMLIVLGISALLSVAALTYTGTARNQIALSVETAKVAESILRAKNLSIATYKANPANCAYGVYINSTNNTYSIFAFAASPAKYGSVPPCPSAASTTAGGITIGTPGNAASEVQSSTPGSWNVPLSRGVRFGTASDNIVAVLFYPPAPVTLISRDGTTFVTSTSRVYLQTTDNLASSSISVNPAGQVNF